MPLRLAASWPAGDIAGKRLAVAVGHQVEHAVAAIAGAARRDDLHEAAEAALRILLGEPGDLGIERRLGLPLDKVRTRPIDKQQDTDHRDLEDQELKPGRPTTVGATQPPGPR